jgi:hypothetical protein
MLQRLMKLPFDAVTGYGIITLVDETGVWRSGPVSILVHWKSLKKFRCATTSCRKANGLNPSSYMATSSSSAMGVSRALLVKTASKTHHWPRGIVYGSLLIYLSPEAIVSSVAYRAVSEVETITICRSNSIHRFVVENGGVALLVPSVSRNRFRHRSGSVP